MDEHDSTLTWAHDWRPEARSYLERLGGHLEKREVTDRPISLPIGQATLLVTQSEVDLVLRLLGGGAPEGRLEGLMADAVGLKVKLLANVKVLDSSDDPTRITEAREALAVDVDHVAELAADFQALVSEHSKTDDFDGAKKVADHRRRLIEVVDHAERLMPGVTATTNLPVRDQASSHTQDYDPRAAAKAKARHLARDKKKNAKTPKGAKGQSTRQVIAAVVAALAGGSLIGTLALVLMLRQPDLARFSANDLRSVPGVVQVVPRPPDIIVVISDPAWNRLTAAERTTAMEDIIALVEPAGYARAEIRTPTRQGLGVWTDGSAITVTQ